MGWDEEGREDKNQVREKANIEMNNYTMPYLKF